MNIQIPERLEADFVHAVARLATKHAEQRINEEIIKAVEKAAGDALTVTISERVATETNRILDEGWPKTDHYGQGTGKHSLRSMIIARLTARSDNYGRDETNVGRIVSAAIREAMHKELKDELEKARAAFRGRVDTVLNAELQTALRKSLGIGQ